ncbi:hypothetical protein [Labilibaculum sp.]|nr:hypothetical protein [Labilibaculum sp.]
MHDYPKNSWKAANDSCDKLNGNFADAKKECMRYEEKIKELG